MKTSKELLSIGIIIPSWHYWVDPTRIQPMHELHYATVIESTFSQKGVSVEIIDLRGINLDQQLSHIPERDLYFYWIMKSGDYMEIQFLVNELRLIYPNAKHIAGGTHVDMCPNECETLFDSIVVGPGEESFTKIIDSSLNGVLDKSVYKTDYVNVPYGDYPYMKRHFLPKSAIVNFKLFEKYGNRITGTCVQFSRGCSLKCAYCVYNMPTSIQYRTLDSLAEEITYLKTEFGVDAINLKDEIALPFSAKQCLPYLDTIGEAGIMWRGQTTVYGAKAEHLKVAGESGCVELATGIESASPLVREIVSKKMSDDKIRDFIDNSHAAGIKVKMCLILGLPGEPQDIVDRTIKFIEHMEPDFVSVSGFDPFPGSPIYNNQEYYGIKYVDEDWGKHAHLLFRFSDNENVGLPFEYEEENQWGKTFTKDQIIENIQTVQTYCRENNMTY